MKEEDNLILSGNGRVWIHVLHENTSKDFIWKSHLWFVELTIFVLWVVQLLLVLFQVKNVKLDCKLSAKVSTAGPKSDHIVQNFSFHSYLYTYFPDILDFSYCSSKSIVHESRKFCFLILQFHLLPFYLLFFFIYLIHILYSWYIFQGLIWC